MKKPFESKAKRLYSIFASVFFMLAFFVVPAFAEMCIRDSHHVLAYLR